MPIFWLFEYCGVMFFIFSIGFKLSSRHTIQRDSHCNCARYARSVCSNASIVGANDYRTAERDRTAHNVQDLPGFHQFGAVFVL